jgi:phospholipid/cholesterol/gamma-HCH transport system permease protein
MERGASARAPWRLHAADVESRSMQGAPAKDMLQAQPGESGVLRIVLRGDWLLHGEATPDSTAFRELVDGAPETRGIAFDARELGRWDATLLVGLAALLQHARARELDIDADGLPDGAQRLLQLAGTVGEREGARRGKVRHGLVKRTGLSTLKALESGVEVVAFLGELCFSMLRLLRGRAVFDRRDLLLFIQQAGASALPIVSLIAFLVGVIFAFVGIKQLEQFGAGIFVADLVAIAMVREMAAIMTGIILAGRSGAAFAAQLGTMKVNEEIDALRTLGISAMDYLVLPRAIALILMMPLLAAYAALLGIVGGALVSLLMMDLSLVQYIEQTRNAVDVGSVLGGLLKAVVFGIVIAISGCQRGMACGGSAMAVGQATTSAVVMAVLLIVITASILTVIYTAFGI